MFFRRFKKNQTSSLSGEVFLSFSASTASPAVCSLSVKLTAGRGHTKRLLGEKKQRRDGQSRTDRLCRSEPVFIKHLRFTPRKHTEKLN